jgi:fatty acid desaturase
MGSRKKYHGIKVLSEGKQKQGLKSLWLMAFYGLTQHAQLQENSFEYSLNCDTVYITPIHGFLYWNMNYHTDYHISLLVSGIEKPWSL